MKKSIIAVLFVLVVALLGFAACDTDSPPEPPVTHAFSVTAGANGSVSGTTSGNYAVDADIAVTASSDSGYVFDGWYEGTSKVSSLSTYSFKMPDRDLALEARFVRVYALTITAGTGGSAGGTVSGEYTEGAAISLTASASTGYKFAGWYEGDTLKSADNPYAFAMPASALALEARFVGAYALTVTAGTGGSAGGTVSDEYTEGTAISLTASASTGYKFDGWYEGDTLKSTDNPYAFAMPASSLALEARFVRVYALTVTAGTGGSVNDTAVNGEYEVGDSVTVVATADAGYRFVDWFDGTASVSTAASYTFDMTANALALEARFVRVYGLTVTAGTGGSVNDTAVNGEYEVGDSVTVVATAEAGYRFVDWFDGTASVSTAASYTFDITANALTLEARFVRVYGLTVTAGTGGSAGGTVSGEYVEGASISLTASASTGYKFDGWYEGDTLKSADNPYAFAMPTNALTLEARFVRVYALTVTAGTGGSVNDTAVNGEYEVGDSVTVVATAEAGYRFVDWFDGTASVSTAASYTFDITASALALEARFVRVYALTVTAGTGGSVNDTAVNGEYEVGDSVTVVATADAGYRFVDWFDGTASVSANASYTFDMTASALALEARFVRVYALTITAGTGGSVNDTAVNGEYEVGDSVTVVATAEAGYRFVDWFDGTASVSANASYTFDMTANALALEARFVRVYALTVTAGQDGSVNDSVNGEYEAGETVTVVATADSGFDFVAWYVDGVRVGGAGSSFAFDMPARDYEIEARFAARANYQLTLTALTGGVIDASGDQSGAYLSGTSITVIATAGSGFAFGGWYFAGNRISESASYTFVMPAENYAIEARFDQLYTLTISATTGGSVGGTAGGNAISLGASEYIATTAISLTATAEANYIFAGWYENGAFVHSSLNYTTNMPEAALAIEARFTRVYSLTATATTGGSVDGSANDYYVEGADISLSATADSGFEFVGWFANDTLVHSDATYEFKMSNSNLTLEARFARLYTLTITQGEGGTVDGTVGGASYSETGEYIAGTAISLTATADANYIFAGWYKNGSFVHSNANYTADTTEAALVLEARFTRVYNLTVTETAGGSTSGTADGKYAAGEDISLEATPESDFAFVGWFKDGNLEHSEATYTFSMTAGDLSLEARFARLYSFSTIFNQGGSIGGTTDGNYIAGTQITVTASADINYTFDGWYIDGIWVSDELEYSTVMPEDDLELEAYFERLAGHDFATALTLTYGDNISDIISNYGNYTFYKVTLDEGDYRFVAQGDGNAYLKIYLYSAPSYNAYMDESELGETSLLDVFLLAGTYYIEVEDQNDSGDEIETWIHVLNEERTGENYALAFLLGTDGTPVSTLGNDSNLFRVTITTSGYYLFSMTSQNGVFAYMDIQKYQQAFYSIEYTTLGIDPELVTYLVPGVYFLQIWLDDDVIVTLTAQSTQAAAGETIQTAIDITPVDTQQGKTATQTIEAGSRATFLTFTADTEGYYLIETSYGSLPFQYCLIIGDVTALDGYIFMNTLADYVSEVMYLGVGTYFIAIIAPVSFGGEQVVGGEVDVVVTFKKPGADLSTPLELEFSGNPAATDTGAIAADSTVAYKAYLPAGYYTMKASSSDGNGFVYAFLYHEWNLDNNAYYKQVVIFSSSEEIVYFSGGVVYFRVENHCTKAATLEIVQYAESEGEFINSAIEVYYQDGVGAVGTIHDATATYFKVYLPQAGEYKITLTYTLLGTPEDMNKVEMVIFSHPSIEDLYRLVTMNEDNNSFVDPGNDVNYSGDFVVVYAPSPFIFIRLRDFSDSTSSISFNVISSSGVITPEIVGETELSLDSSGYAEIDVENHDGAAYFSVYLNGTYDFEARMNATALVYLNVYNAPFVDNRNKVTGKSSYEIVSFRHHFDEGVYYIRIHGHNDSMISFKFTIAQVQEDMFAAAKNISAGDVAMVEDEQVFKFKPTEAGTYMFYSNHTDDLNADPFLDIYDRYMSHIFHTDDNLMDCDFAYFIEVTASDIVSGIFYYFHAYNYGKTDNNYEVRLIKSSNSTDEAVELNFDGDAGESETALGSGAMFFAFVVEDGNYTIEVTDGEGAVALRSEALWVYYDILENYFGYSPTLTDIFFEAGRYYLLVWDEGNPNASYTVKVVACDADGPIGPVTPGTPGPDNYDSVLTPDANGEYEAYYHLPRDGVRLEFEILTSGMYRLLCENAGETIYVFHLFMGGFDWDVNLLTGTYYSGEIVAYLNAGTYKLMCSDGDYPMVKITITKIVYTTITLTTSEGVEVNGNGRNVLEFTPTEAGTYAIYTAYTSPGFPTGLLTGTNGLTVRADDPSGYSFYVEFEVTAQDIANATTFYLTTHNYELRDQLYEVIIKQL